MNKRVKTFKVITYNEPVIEYMPVDAKERAETYEKYRKTGNPLPNYSLFGDAIALEKVDIIIINDELTLDFAYMGKIFKLIVKRGACLDGASIPDFLSVGRISKISQYSLSGATAHDFIFGMKYLDFDHANDVFEGFLRHKNMPSLALTLHMFAVRSFIGKAVYNSPNKKSAFQNGYSELYMDGERVKDYARLKFK